ncbi:MAG: phospho-sugar mutase [Clostridia bacterium]
MNYMDRYKRWLEKADADTVKELSLIRDEKEIEDRFYRTLEFGTAGLRGIMGAGTNRMNDYVVGQATQALANHIKKQNLGPEKGVVIAFDCRINSREYAKDCALTLCANGIRTYLFENLRPTPELSFAIRHLGAISGINITASHNPKEYNGYKVFWEKGSQILSDVGDELLREMENLDEFDDVMSMGKEEAMKAGLLHIIGKEIDDLFVERVKGLTLREDVDKDIRVVYTPLNGTGIVFIPRILQERGFRHITVVSEQAEPDGTFPTTPYPNPEDPSTFGIALGYANREDSDLLMATDPDGDRIAVMVRNGKGGYVFLNGNQLGVLLLDYIVNQKEKNGTLDQKDVLIKTIVTGDMGKKIISKKGIRTFETLTGFKHIHGLYNQLEEEGEYGYLFGYEESIGYCPETFTRDKNAISTAMLIVEMCAWYKSRGKTLYGVLYELYETYGHYRETQASITYRGIEGVRIKDMVMTRWRKGYPEEIAGRKVTLALDYLEPVEDHIEPSNVLKYILEDGSWYAVRPSGTEPKLKIYLYSLDDSEKKSLKKLEDMEKDILRCLKEFEKE